jgi:hypothetical protein
MTVLKVQVVTPLCEEGTAYLHRVRTEADTPEAALKANYAILDAIFTLYAIEEIIEFTVSVDEEDDDEEDNGTG